MKKIFFAKKSIGLLTALTLALSAVVCSYAEEADEAALSDEYTDVDEQVVSQMPYHEIKIGLNYSSTALDTLTLECDGGFFVSVVSYGEEPVPIDVNALSFEVTDGMLYAKTAFGEDVAASPENEIIRVYPTNHDSVIYAGGNPYRGGFEIYASDGKITLINFLDIEDYIKGVLPSEVYTSWHTEALKSAAVVSRTYALKNAGSSSHTSYGFDVCATTHCQMYSGVKKENVNTNRAIAETAGLVVKYNGVLAMTPYHSSTGGYTESAADAWGSSPADYPYLTEVFNPYEQYLTVPNGKWHSVVARDELLSFVPDSYKAKLSALPLAFDYDRSQLGFIPNMTVTDSDGRSVSLRTSSAVRSFFGSLVKSANFMISEAFVPSDNAAAAVSVISSDGVYELTGLGGYEYIDSDGVHTANGFDEVYVFDGMGYGHGVGMSQFGARDMANAGFTYDEILQTYFPGTEILPLTE